MPKPSPNSDMLHILLTLLCVLVAGASGCSKVDHCPKGELRCLGGLCEDQQCDFDLRCMVQMSSGEELCAKRISGNRYDFGDKGKGEGYAPGMLPPEEVLDCECEAPSVCAADGKTCVNYCEPIDKLPGSGPFAEVFFCEHLEGETPYTYADICRLQCQNTCLRWQQFCGFTCEPGYCERQEVKDACEAQCPSADANARQCLTRECNTVRDQTCAQVICPDTQQPASCDGMVCKNTCGPQGSPGEFAGDGFCDDGDLYSADYAACPWGSDCVDCGPRMGKAPEPQPNGGVCAFHSGCLGYDRDLTKNKAWCLRLDDVQQGLVRCMPDCTRTGECPTGYECFEVEDDAGKPIVQNSLTGKACLPLLCGG